MTRYEFESEYLDGRGWTRLYLVQRGKIVKFQGENIPAFAVIAAKESYTWGEKYILLLAPETCPLRIVPPPLGEWGEWYECWDDLARDLGVGLDEARRFAATEFPAIAERLDAVEECLRGYKAAAPLKQCVSRDGVGRQREASAATKPRPH